MAHPSVPAANIKDLLKLAKERPGKLNYASSGPGTPYHMAGELFKSMSGVYLVHIPYRGSSGARTDVMGGQVDLMFDAVTTMAEQVKAGKVKALATTGMQRSSVLPDVPTVHEAGVPNYEATIWLGLLAPKGTPKAIVDRLNEAVIEDRQPARRAPGMGPPGRDADGDDAGGLREIHPGRHRQVGAGDQVRQHQGRVAWQSRSACSAAAPRKAWCAAAGPLSRRAAAVAVEGTLRRRGRHAGQAARRRAVRPGDPHPGADRAAGRRRAMWSRGSAAPLGVVKTGVAVKAGEPAPDVATAAALKAALLRREGIYFPDPRQGHRGHSLHEGAAGRWA